MNGESAAKGGRRITTSDKSSLEVMKGSEEQIKQAFYAVMDTIAARIQKLLALDLTALDADALQCALTAIPAGE